MAMPDYYRYSSAGQYQGNDNNEIEVEIIDFGIQEGYVAM